MNGRVKKRFMILAAGLLVFAPAFSAQAAEDSREEPTGWQQEGEQWIYINRDGSRAYDTWIKEDSGWYYVDEDGYMAADEIVEKDGHLCYVDIYGVMIRNRWVSRPNKNRELWDEDVDVVWYYFDSKGRAEDEEGKAVLLMENGDQKKYFFDEDGHMLSGWQRITDNDGNENIYYLGAEDEGYAHLRWQYLEPDPDMMEDEGDMRDYDPYEMFYFGWDGKMSRNEEAKLENHYYLFDENGVMLTGWQPGISIDDEDFSINKYYDEVTGVRASEWFYAYDPGEKDEETAHWFYADKKNGTVYNEGGEESDEGGLASKRINGETYFFDSQGRMITGLISTDGTELATDAFSEDEFAYLDGDIGKANRKLAAGIYYLSQDEGTLGQLQKDEVLKLNGGGEKYYYCLDNRGRAYINALCDGYIYGPDGVRIKPESGEKEAVVITESVYKDSGYNGRGEVKEGEESIIEEGETVILESSGKVKKEGRVKVDGETYQVDNYVAVLAEDEED